MKPKQKPILSEGFVRVYIPGRNKTTRIPSYQANNKDYMAKHGMVILAIPEPPPVAYVTPPQTALDMGYPATPVIQADNDEPQIKQTNKNKHGR